MDKSELTLSVVVISWNQIAFIRRLTDQLLDQTLSSDRYEIIIVDDGSTDGTQEWLRGLDNSQVKSIITDRRCGRSGSRNLGIRHARGAVIVMIDGDHTIRRDFLQRHADRHAAEHCVIVGKSDFVDHPDYRALNAYLNGSGATKLPRDARLPGRYFLTRNCSVPRQALLDIGLFDEKFEAWGGEDLDLGVRLEDAGLPIYGDRNAHAIHHHLRPLPDLLVNMKRYGESGIPLLLRKHPRLFRELNLDRALPNPYDQNRFSAVTQLIYRFVFTAPFYFTVKAVATFLRRHRLPRFIFDYLHLRQYTRGYVRFLKSKSL